MADPWFADGSLLVGQRAALLIERGRTTEAQEYLLENDDAEQYISRFMLAARAVIEGDHELASERLRRTRSALLSEARAGNWEPELRYIEILELINQGKSSSAAGAALEPGNWPNPLLAYLRAEIGEAALVPALYPRDGLVDRERLRETPVYFGIRAASQGLRTQAERYFEAAADLSIYDYIEHAIAQSMLATD